MTMKRLNWQWNNQIRAEVETEEQKAARLKKEVEEQKRSVIDDPAKLAAEEEKRQLLARLQRQDEQLAELRGLISKKDEPPKPTTDEKNKRFWSDPSSVLQEALDETVKPLRQFVEETRAGSEYGRLRERYSSDPKYKSMFENPKVSAMIDDLMSKNAPNDNAMKAVLFGVRGAIEMGEIPGITLESKKDDSKVDDKKDDKKDEPKGKDKDYSMLPPHLRPSGAPGPKDSEREAADDKKYREMAENADENQRRLAREAKMSLEDYFRMDDIKPLDVVSTYLDNDYDKAALKRAKEVRGEK